ncbi:hypothetical protein STANM309S_04305 [Streptomyces tanashiensis]
MLPMTRRPSATTDGSVAKLLFRRTIWATALVASEPEPIETPMSGVLQGQDVVDAVARHGDRVAVGLERRHHRSAGDGGDDRPFERLGCLVLR